MAEVFCEIFTDKHFLGTFIQTVAIIFLGFFFRNRGLITVEGKKAVADVVWKIAVPCFAFNAFMQDFNQNDFKAGIAEFFVAALAYALLMTIGKVSFLKKGRDISTICALFFAVGQTTLFSMPILHSVYSGRNGEDQVMLYISIISIAFRLMVYLVGFYVISGQRFEIKNIGGSLRKIFLTPIMVGMFCGMAVYLTQNIVPQTEVSGSCYSVFRFDKTLPVIYQTIRTLSGLVNPLAMLVIGMSVGEGKLKEAFCDKMAWGIAVLRNVAAPVFVAVLVFALNKFGIISFNEYAFTTIVIAFSAPVSVTLCIFCVQYHRAELLASRICVISTLLSLVTMPLVFVLCSFAAGK